MSGAARRAVLLGLAAALGGCAQPEAPSRLWLVGSWAPEGRCDALLDTALRADGTYGMGDGGGRWSLVGDRLTISEARRPGIQLMQARLGDPGISILRRLGPDRLEARPEGGPPSAYGRCPSR